ITVVWFFCSECSLELLGLTKSLCSLRIFKVLHTVQFSRFFVVASAATLIVYHLASRLSTTFFYFFQLSFFQIFTLLLPGVHGFIPETSLIMKR
ncbi:hypothetical protein, partial [[Clostridium] symbiosum]